MGIPQQQSLDVPTIFIPEQFEVLRRPKRIKVFFGGRNSAKTESCGRQVLLNLESSQTPYNVVCARMFQNSIDDSLYSMFREFNTEYQFGFDDSANKIRNHRNKGRITFQGIARNIKSIKSKFRANLFWADEAEDVSDEAWKIILPTFREQGSEIWVTFNPNDESDATYQRFVVPYLEQIKRDGFYEDETIYVRKINYDENPFLTEVSRREIETLKLENYKEYLHVYEGEPLGAFDDAIIQPEWFDAAVDAHKKLGFDAVGEVVKSLDLADTGTDAKSLISRHGVLIDGIEQWHEGDLYDCLVRAFDQARDDDADNLIYDAGGMGAGAKVYLKEKNIKHSFEIEGFDGGAGVADPDALYKDERKNKDMFRNKRAQYYWYLRDRFYDTYMAVEKGRYKDPATLISLSSDLPLLKELRSELIRVPLKKTAGSRVLQIMSKVEMKRKGLSSPNMADALMMSFAVSDKPIVYVPEYRPPVNYR